MTFKNFQKIVWHYYKKHGRSFPWRNTKDPYKIFISEVMLQQTQVSRVLQKYPEFIKAFPNFRALANSSLSDVLKVWQGMGYNRRALYLRRAAEIVAQDYKGILPDDPALLEKLPGIGKATAASIVAFAFNKPSVFIETNIRRVFIYHFFSDLETGRPRGRPVSKVHDQEIFPLVKKTLDRKNPREWYWALMDYGTHLAKILRQAQGKYSNPNRASAHYIKQSKFKGSHRQLRGKVLRALLKESMSVVQLCKHINANQKKILACVFALEQEGLLRKHHTRYCIAV